MKILMLFLAMITFVFAVDIYGTTVAIDPTVVQTLAGALILGGASLWVIRKLMKLINRSWFFFLEGLFFYKPFYREKKRKRKKMMKININYIELCTLVFILFSASFWTVRKLLKIMKRSWKNENQLWILWLQCDRKKSKKCILFVS